MKRRMVFLLMWLIVLSGGSSMLYATDNEQLPADQTEQVDLSTPYHSIRTHLHFLQPDSYEPEKAARAFLHPQLSPDKARSAAIKLKQVLDGKGYFINIEAAPKQPDYQDTITGKQRYTPTDQLPGVFLVKRDDSWLYSMESIANIDHLHHEVFPFGSDILLEFLPQAGSKTYLGLYLWQYIGIVMLVLLSVLIHKLLSFILNRVLYKSAYRLGYDNLVRPYLLPVARPLSLFIIFLFIIALFPILQLPIVVGKHITLIIRGLIPFFATRMFYKLVNVLSLYLEKKAGKSESSLDNHVVPLIRKMLRVFVVIIGGLVILQTVGVNITALVAGISIGGLAIALAAQDTLKNLFGSLMIFIDKPFTVGHWITSGDVDGSVEEVSFRSTRVRTFRNSLIYVPNSKLADSTIDNHGLRRYRRFFMHIAITYDTPPDLIEVFVEGLQKIVETHPRIRKDFYIVKFNEMGDFSLKIMFYIFFAVPTWQEEMQARHEVLIEIVRLAEKLGVRFAFPTSTMHMESFPGKLSLTPNYDMTMEEFREVMEDYFKKR